jgi:6-phosphogluconolactonase
MAVPPPARSAPFVYVTNAAGSTSVSQYAVGAGGLLSPLVPPAVPAGAIAEGVAVNPDGRSVYVGNAGADTISQYGVSLGGLLSPKSPPTVRSYNPESVAVSPDGRSVYVANGGQPTVSQYDVGADGSLSPKNPPTVAAAGSPLGVATARTGGRSTSRTAKAARSPSTTSVQAEGSPPRARPRSLPPVAPTALL